MTSAEAREILEQSFPGESIEEVSGNPTLFGWWLWIVGGNLVYVDEEGGFDFLNDKEAA